MALQTGLKVDQVILNGGAIIKQLESGGNIQVVPASTEKFELSNLKLTGEMSANSQKISGLPTPTADDEVSTKGYTNSQIAAAVIGLFTYKGTMAGNRNLVTSPLATIKKGDFYKITTPDGNLTVADGTIAVNIGDDIIFNKDVATPAEVVIADIDKIDNTEKPLTDAHIFVGNASNVATDVAMSGDVSITNTGATSIASAVGADGTKIKTGIKLLEGVSSIAVAFTAFADTNYSITLTVDGNYTAWYTSKAVGGFTINLSTVAPANPNGVTVDYQAVKY